MDLEKEKTHRLSFTKEAPLKEICLKEMLIKESEPSESAITSANRLLTDLKKAYTQALKDKEIQIQSLKEEISNLKTLVQVLESENERLVKSAD